MCRKTYFYLLPIYKGFLLPASKAAGYPNGDFLFVYALQKTQKIFWEQIPNPDKKRGKYMEKRKRNIQIKFRVTEEEKQLIEQKMAQLPTWQIGAYLRKMAIDGLIIYTDTTNIKEMNKELHSIGVNINQIAKRVNETGSIYEEDIKEIQERLNKIWQLQRTILLTLP